MSAAQNGSAFSNVFSSSSAQGRYYKAFRAIDMASFVQDDVKINPRLTLNTGVRWELNGGVSEAFGNMSSLFPGIAAAAPAPTAAGSFAGFVVPSNYSLPVPAGVTVLPGKTLASNGMPLHNFGPRFGFAWQPFSNSSGTVVRGGYGAFYTMPNGNSILQVLTSQPFVSTAALSSTSNAAATFAVPFTTVLTPGVWRPRTNTSQLATTVVANNIDSPMTQQYNLDVQQQLFANTVLEAGYVGTRGTRLSESRNINLPLLASPSSPINGITTNTVANAALRVPYVGFSPTSLTRIETYGFAMYNSLQVTVKRQMSHGVQLQGAYTWGKTMTTVANGNGQNAVFTGGSGNINNPNDRSQRYGPAQFDRTNRFVFVYTWQLPELHQGYRMVRTASTGWAVSGVTTLQTGTPLQFTDSLGGIDLWIRQHLACPVCARHGERRYSDAERIYDQQAEKILQHLSILFRRSSGDRQWHRLRQQQNRSGARTGPGQLRYCSLEDYPGWWSKRECHIGLSERVLQRVQSSPVCKPGYGSRNGELRNHRGSFGRSPAHSVCPEIRVLGTDIPSGETAPSFPTV